MCVEDILACISGSISFPVPSLVADGHQANHPRRLGSRTDRAIIVLPQGVAFATIAVCRRNTPLCGDGAGHHWCDVRLQLALGIRPHTAISIVIFASVSPLAEPVVRSSSACADSDLPDWRISARHGLARMGVLVNFISHTVVIGFTAGAAVLIAASQIKNFFGINIPRGSHFYEIIHQLALQSATSILTLLRLLWRHWPPAFW